MIIGNLTKSINGYLPTTPFRSPEIFSRGIGGSGEKKAGIKHRPGPFAPPAFTASSRSLRTHPSPLPTWTFKRKWSGAPVFSGQPFTPKDKPIITATAEKTRTWAMESKAGISGTAIVSGSKDGKGILYKRAEIPFFHFHLLEPPHRFYGFLSAGLIQVAINLRSFPERPCPYPGISIGPPSVPFRP